MVADPANAIAPLSAPDKPLPAVVMEPLKRSRLRQLDRRQWIAAGLAVLIAASGLVVWRRSSAPGRDISAYTTTVKTGQLDGAEGEIGSLGLGVGHQGIEQGGLAHIGQANDSGFEHGGNLGGRPTAHESHKWDQKDEEWLQT